MSYAWHQLQCAVRALSGTAEQRNRLISAYNKLVKLKPKDLPSEVAADFDRLVGSIPRFPVKNIAREVKTEVQSLTDEEVSQAIDAIGAIHDAVSVYQPRKFSVAPRRVQPVMMSMASCPAYEAVLG